MKPLSRADFIDALKKGKGRALQHIREFGDEGFREELLHACLNNLEFDHQCEDRRPWVINLIDAAPEPGFYHQSIMDRFIETVDFYDVQQMSAVLAHAARRGNAQAGKLLYRKFDLHEYSEDWLIGADIVGMDGITGLLHVGEFIGRRIRNNPDDYDDGSLAFGAFDALGKDAVLTTLTKAADENIDIRAYLDNLFVRIALSEQTPQPPNTSKKVSLNDYVDHVAANSGAPSFGASRAFGRFAAPTELAELFEFLKVETSNRKLASYLHVFSYKALPDVTPELLALAKSPDEKLRRGAVRALGNTRHNAVRNLALTMLQSGQLAALGLLRKNLEPGDLGLVLPKLGLSGDDDVDHRTVIDLMELTEGQSDEVASKCLLWAYEHSPCSYCRRGAVEMLLKLQNLPPMIAEECLSDCEDETREAVTRWQNENVHSG